MPWVDPPKLKGSRAPTTAGGLSTAELGRRVEHALAQHLGFELLHPSIAQGPFDLGCGDAVFEVKAVTTAAHEYKAKPSRAAVLRKRAAAVGKVPHTLIAPVDLDAGVVHAYARRGIGAFRLTSPSQGWEYLGSAPINLAA